MVAATQPATTATRLSEVIVIMLAPMRKEGPAHRARGAALDTGRVEVFSAMDSNRLYPSPISMPIRSDRANFRTCVKPRTHA